MTDQLTRTAAQADQLTKFADPLRIPPTIRPDGDDLTIHLRAANVRVHSELPPVPMWCYNGVFPGPTIEVRRGTELRVEYRNKIVTPYPAAAAEVFLADGKDPDAPGRDGATPVEGVDVIPPWAVVHLHGAATDGGHDGWTENAVLPGHTQNVHYQNDQRATALWYHDHAMAVTQYNVFAGLAGMYLIRDDEEDALDLPSGQYEVPLVITDRNFDTDADGHYTGRMLKKVLNVATADAPVRVPFSGPFNLVNGVLWPHFDVAPRWYRFRVLDACNSRIYELSLVDEDGAAVPEGVAYQIGTDSGLLGEPVPLTEPVSLSPAERLDILVDFAAYRGKTLRLIDNTDPDDPVDIMQFRVGARPSHDRFTLPDKLSPTFRRITRGDVPADAKERFVVFMADSTGMPEMWEMAEGMDMPMADDDQTFTDGMIEVKLPGESEPRMLHRVARTFEETKNYFVEAAGWEVWHLLHLGGPSHPFHIHLIGFQVLSRYGYSDLTNFVVDGNKGGTTEPLTESAPIELSPSEQGWKDVIRVNPGDLVTWAGQFTGGTGQYMYHCHLLEHEDEGMMRHFAVVPAEVMAVDETMGRMAQDITKKRRR